MLMCYLLIVERYPPWIAADTRRIERCDVILFTEAAGRTNTGDNPRRTDGWFAGYIRERDIRHILSRYHVMIGFGSSWMSGRQWRCAVAALMPAYLEFIRADNIFCCIPKGQSCLSFLL